MKLSFTTLACPDWPWDKVLGEALNMGYEGIELRIVDGEMRLWKAKPFLPDNINETVKAIRSANLQICCVDTSCSFHEIQSFENSVEEGKAAIDLAAQLGALYIRVFGDVIPNEAEEMQTISQVAKGLDILGRYAEGKGIEVLLELHGDFSVSDRVLALLKRTSSPAIGVLWDINNPYRTAGESMQETYEKLGGYIRHTHFKDSIGRDKSYVLPGQGDLPMEEALTILRAADYKGWLSFEWEKKWHPEIEEPEVALPIYLSHMKSLLEKINSHKKFN